MRNIFENVDFVDLTHTFRNAMPVYPGDTPPVLRTIARISEQGFSDHRVETGMHVGTHVDAPLHMLEGGADVASLPLRQFFGPGLLIDAHGRYSLGVELVSGRHLKPGQVVIIYTGLGASFGSKRYFDNYPQIEVALAEELVRAGVGLVGLDTPSADECPFAAHKALLDAGIPILENLANLELLLGREFHVIALPAKYASDAAPVRVVACVQK